MSKPKQFVKCKNCNKNNSKNCRLCKGTGKVINPKLVLCNLCGSEMCPKPPSFNSQIPHGLYNAKVIGGYDSEHLLDMSQYVFSLCEKCLRELFDKCKIPPAVNDVDADGNPSYKISYAQDKEWYDYSIWKKEGHFHTAYLNRKCNQKKNCPNDAVYSLLINDQLYDDCCCEEHKFEGGSFSLNKFIPNELKIFI